MVDDIKRTMLIDGSGVDGEKREGDDIYKNDTDAPQLPQTSPRPVTLQSVAAHLRALTSDSINGNKYRVTDAVSIIKLHDDNGEPAAINTPNASVADVFADASLLAQLGVIGETFDAETIAALRDPNVGFHELLKRVIGNPQASLQKNDGTTQNASSGRAEIADPPNVTELQKNISNVLKRNRFNPQPGRTPFAVRPAASTIDQRAIGVTQETLGAYDNKPANQSNEVTYEMMKRVGLALMLRATGEFIGKDGNPLDTGVGLGALVPGAAQLAATKVDKRSMEASSLSAEQGRPPSLTNPNFALDSQLMLDDGASSYGNLNSFIEPFTGFAPAGMSALGAALVVALKVVSEGIALLLKIPSPPSSFGDTSQAAMPDGAIRMMGSSRYEAASASETTAAVFGLTSTHHNFARAFDRGVDVFFEFDGTDFLRVVQSPGYYVVMIREIIRSSSRITSSITDAFSSGNAISAVQSLLGIVDIIKSSKLISYVNMVARLGDNILWLEDEGMLPVDGLGVNSEPGELPQSGKISIQDMLVDSPASRVMKSRSSFDGVSLAWRNSSTPSAYLLPSSVLSAAEHDVTTKLNLETFIDSEITSKNLSSRLPSDVVEKLENELDSEYVPFYFHDVRTNEIISFHAFISALTDSFNANYENSSYVGRVEPVRIYGGTERTVNLTFNVISTSEQDFNVMWWKINKLVSMLYPQWSRGQKLTVGEDTFIQPFSQVPTSSPLIRLRLGDVLKSNYSRFALARLFGLGTSDYNVDGVQTDPARVAENIRIIEKTNEIFKRMLAKPMSSGDLDTKGYFKNEKARLRPTAGPLFLAPSGLASLGVSIPNTPGQDGGKPIKSLSTHAAVTISDVKLIAMASKLVEPVYFITVDEPPKGFSKGPYQVNHFQLSPDVDYIKTQLVQENIQDVPEDDIAKVEEFFKPENNAIVRSFESTSGRGLAGVIPSMAFDWKTPTWDTTNIGRRAPQWCQITMTFMPIHDIPPGLDSDGFMRAPVYNVGDIVNGIGGDVYRDEQNKAMFKINHDKVSKNRKTRG